MASVQETLERFDQMVAKTSALLDICRKHPPQLHPLELQPTNLTPIEWLTAACKDIWYQGDQDGRLTRNYYGVVVVHDGLFKAFDQLNQEKEAFKQACLSLKNALGKDYRSVQQTLAKRHPDHAELLGRHGLARIHLKQCYRTFPLLDPCPTHISFSWYQSGRSITKVTAAEARQALQKLDANSQHIQIQLRKLDVYDDSTLLAKVQNQAPLLRANIRYNPQQAGIIQERKAFNTALPIILSQSNLFRLPLIKPPKENEPSVKRTRATRSDLIVEETPFLPSLRVHRYLNGA